MVKVGVGVVAGADEWVVLEECVGDRAVSEGAAVRVVAAVVYGVLQYIVPTEEQMHIFQHQSLPP